MFFIKEEDLPLPLMQDSDLYKPYNLPGFQSHIDKFSYTKLNEKERRMLYWHLYLKKFGYERSLHYKILTHPYVSTTDLTDIMTVAGNNNRRTAAAVLLVLGSLSWKLVLAPAARKHQHTKFVRNITLLTIFPMATLLGMTWAQNAYVDSVARQKNLDQKYRIDELQEFAVLNQSLLDKIELK